MAEEEADALALAPVAVRRASARTRPLVALVAALLVAAAAVSMDGGGADPGEEVAAGGASADPDDPSRRAVIVAEPSTSSPTSTSTSVTEGSSTSGDAPSSGDGPADGISGAVPDQNGGRDPEGSVPPQPPSSQEPTTTTLPCTSPLNSREPGCGPLQWTTEPQPNQPMTVSIELLTLNPKVGDTIRVRVTASDPDATPYVYPVVNLGGLPCWNGSGASPGYGPWDPPATRGGTTEQIAVWTWSRPPPAGTYRLTVCVRSHSWVRPSYADHLWCPGDPARRVFEETFECHDPYADAAVPSTQVTISPAG